MPSSDDRGESIVNRKPGEARPTQRLEKRVMNFCLSPRINPPPWTRMHVETALPLRHKRIERQAHLADFREFDVGLHRGNDAARPP